MIRAFKVGAGWGFRRGRLTLIPYRTYETRRLMWRVFYSSGASIAFGRFETAWESFTRARAR